MVDRNHFWFKNDYLYCDNRCEGYIYYIATYERNQWICYDYISLATLHSTSECVSDAKIFTLGSNIPISFVMGRDIDSLSMMFDTYEYIGLVLYPDGELYVGNNEFDEVLINKKSIKSLKINNKIVQSIQRLSDNQILYERNVEGLIPSIITLSGNKSILSYSDNEECILTAHVTDSSDEPISGETVTFKQDGSILSTNVTDENGEATYVYKSKGVGDVSFTAEVRSLLSETYSIEDCIFYTTKEFISDKSNNYIKITDALTLPVKFELTFDYKTNYEARFGLFSQDNFNGNPNYSVFVGSPNGNQWYYGYRTNSTNTTDIYNSPVDYNTYTICRNDTKFTYQINNSTKYSKSVSFFDNYQYLLGIMGWYRNNDSSAVKNIKLKKLD